MDIKECVSRITLVYCIFSYSIVRWVNGNQHMAVSASIIDSRILTRAMDRVAMLIGDR